MVYCAAFYCNTNNSENKIACSWLKFLMEPIFLVWHVVHTIKFVVHTKKAF